MASFKGKRIILTGASRGIGFESARLLLKEGAEVLGTARSQAALDKVRPELEQLGRFIPCVADLGELAAPQRIAEGAWQAWGAVDILVLNAAVQTWRKDWEDEGLELLKEQWKVNVFAQHETLYQVLPMLRKGVDPRVVMVSSGAGTLKALIETPDMPTYRLTKYALNGCMLLWAGQLKGKVAVNALDPGWLKTDLGGPKAPGEPIDGAKRLLEVLSLPASETGGFWHGAKKIDF